VARIAGVDIPREKQIQISLTYIYGVGRTTALSVCARTQVPPTRKVSELTDDETARLREIVERELTVEGDLRRQLRTNIQRLIDIGCYRGLPTGAICRSVGSAPAPTRARVADRARLSASRRRRRQRSSRTRFPVCKPGNTKQTLATCATNPVLFTSVVRTTGLTLPRGVTSRQEAA
jgi:small subunit ribosomal protein S13